MIVAVAKLSYTNGTNGYATNIGEKREIDKKKKNNNINNLERRVTMGTTIHSSNKNIGLKRSWGGGKDQYRGVTVSIYPRRNKFNFRYKSGKRRHEFEDIFLDEGIRINRIQAKFLVELLRKQTIRKKLANDLEKFAKGIEEEEYYDWHS